MPARHVDGMDVVAVERAVRDAAAYVRTGEGPMFLELETFRFRAHSMFDPELYRDKKEVERWRTRDPIATLITRAGERSVLDQDDVGRIESEVEAELAAAVAFAEAGTLETLDATLSCSGRRCCSRPAD